jgi:hypothetical protein
MKKHFKLQNVTIGTDLEMFLKDKSTGELASAIGVFGGTKSEPRSIGNLCYIQEDNILVEANIPPVTCFEDFFKYITYIKQYIADNYPQFDLHFSSSEIAPRELLYDQAARTFGCDPVLIVDYNEDGDVIPEHEFEEQRMAKEFDSLRTGGFHIHFGYDDPNSETNREIVKLFERNVTLPLLQYDNDQHDRRQSYGKSGEYREKSSGLECRSVGSYFLKDESTIKQVWDGVEQTINDFNNGDRVSKQEFEIIKEIIDTHKRGESCPC